MRVSAIWVAAVLCCAAVVALADPATNGPSIACPTCQKKGIPANEPLHINIVRENSNQDIKVSTTPGEYYVLRSQVPDEANAKSSLARFLWENSLDTAMSKWALTLTEMFVLDQDNVPGVEQGPVLDNEGKIATMYRAHQVSFAQENPLVYKWENTKVSDQIPTQDVRPVSSANFQLTGRPKEETPLALKPTIGFDTTFLAHESRTLARVKFQVGDFAEDFWKNDLGGDITNPRFVLVFRIDRMNRAGNLVEPKSNTLKKETPIDATHKYTVLVEKTENADGKEEELSSGYHKIVAGGLDLLFADKGQDGNGQPIDVYTRLGRDISGKPVVYVAFNKFTNSVTLNTYQGLNAYAVFSWASWTTPVFVTILVCVLAAIFMQESQKY